MVMIIMFIHAQECYTDDYKEGKDRSEECVPARFSKKVYQALESLQQFVQRGEKRSFISLIS